jgi:hypothetical protein
VAVGLVLATAFLLCRIPSARGAAFKVGSFVKTTSTAVPVSQVVEHGLGETPKAVILWTGLKSADGPPTAEGNVGLGIFDGTTHRSVGFAAANNTPNSTRRRMANSAIQILEGHGALRSEALMSVTATSMNFSWTTQTETTPDVVVHYIAIGGSAVRAKVRDWSLGTVNPANRVVTGIGFKPDVCVNVWTGPLFLASTSLGTVQDNAKIGIGVMDGAGRQWALFQKVDDNGMSVAYRIQATDAAYLMLAFTAEVRRAAWVSMDGDGFTVALTGSGTEDARIFSICLQNVEAFAGSFDKSIATDTPASQAVTGPPFTPAMVFIASDQASAAVAAQPEARMGIGASDGLAAGSSSVTNENDSRTPDGWGVDSTSHVFARADNNVGAVEADADLTAFTPSGFNLLWTRNDSVPTQILYLALASPGGDLPDAASLDTGPEAAAAGPPDTPRADPGVDAGGPAPPGEDGGPDLPVGPDAPGVTLDVALRVGCGCRAAGAAPGPGGAGAVLTVLPPLLWLWRRRRPRGECR